MLVRKSKKKGEKCRICPNKSFDNENDLILHIRDEHEGKVIDSYMCNVCGKTVKTKSQLTQHIKSKCGSEKKFTCRECGKLLMSTGSLHNHMKKHKEKAMLLCTFCAKVFLLASQLRVHEKSHLNQKDFICDICGKGFCHRQSLITHTSVHTGIKPYQCEDCSKSFSCVGNLLKHRRANREICGSTPFTGHMMQNLSTRIKVRVNTPASSYLKKAKLRQEFEDKLSNIIRIRKETKILEDQINNTNVEGDLEVELSNSVYNNADMVEKSNPVIITGEQKITSTADSELTAFVSTKHLPCQDYEKVVQSSKAQSSAASKTVYCQKYTYICEKCGICFKQKALFELHNSSDCRAVSYYQCEICSKSFKTKHSKKLHMNVHSAKKNYQCSFCGKNFHWGGQLKVHERSHTGEKPYTCLFCPSAFAYRDSLITHSTIHTGTKPYVCKSCGWRFSCVGNLSKHKATHAATCGAWYRDNRDKI